MSFCHSIAHWGIFWLQEVASLLVFIAQGSTKTVPFSFSPCQLCVILEPMQELMSRHKTYSLSPRDCLKTCLFQKWQRMVAPPGENLPRRGWVLGQTALRGGITKPHAFSIKTTRGYYIWTVSLCRLRLLVESANFTGVWKNAAWL